MHVFEKALFQAKMPKRFPRAPLGGRQKINALKLCLEKAKLIKNFDKPRVKHPAVFVDEPLRQVTRKVTFASTTHNAIDGIGMRLYPSGPSIQRNDTYNDDEAGKS